jgi:hypothetical protein
MNGEPTWKPNVYSHLNLGQPHGDPDLAISDPASLETKVRARFALNLLVDLRSCNRAMSHRAHIVELQNWLASRIIGQEKLVNRLVMALLADGHLLVEGAPGLAKTKAIKILADGIEGEFHRVQFTPDLLPSDITGTEIYRVQDGSFEFQKGPIFHNLILADEINRAPAKVQSTQLNKKEPTPCLKRNLTGS